MFQLGPGQTSRAQLNMLERTPYRIRQLRYDRATPNRVRFSKLTTYCCFGPPVETATARTLVRGVPLSNWVEPETPRDTCEPITSGITASGRLDVQGRPHTALSGHNLTLQESGEEIGSTGPDML